MKEVDNIPYPKTVSECEVQSYLLYELRAMGFDARAEVSAGTCRMDIVIFESKHPIRIIEIKKQRRKKDDKFRWRGRKVHSQGPMVHAKQLAKYSRFGVRVDLVAGADNARKYINQIRGGFSHLPIDLATGMYVKDYQKMPKFCETPIDIEQLDDELSQEFREIVGK